MRESLKYALGYLVGGSIFVVAIPLGLVTFASWGRGWFDLGLSAAPVLRYALSALLAAPGFVFMVWSNVYLVKIGKGGPAEGLGVAVSPKTRKLVTEGPYRYSRNPMVFGAYCLYSGIAVLLNSALCLAALACLLLVSVVYLKTSEETRLVRDFGDEYLEYRKKVSMILPFKKG